MSKLRRAKWSWADSPDALRRQRLADARKIATHTNKEWATLVAFCKVCVRCGAPGPLLKDHIKPLYQGGSDGIDNLQPLCLHCNCAKGPEATDHRPDGWQAAVAAGQF